mmetsp:Transcript_7584/g.23623  ORF Transcript_7584/g.23623 Transcript_7584/m.23623 type:complete len:245 (-) Transcript_7584:158-892(-)
MEVDGEEDEVVMRIPMMLGPMRERGGSTCLLQYPLRPRWRPYEMDKLTNAQIRPKQHQMEMDLSIPVSSDAMDNDSTTHTCRLTSTVTVHKTQYAVGLLRMQGRPTSEEDVKDVDGENSTKAFFHLAPLDACVQMRPAMAEHDDQKNEGVEVKGGSAEKGAGTGPSAATGTSGANNPGEATSVLPVFKRAETEKEEEARRTSHAYWLQQREAEPWRKVIMHEEGDLETNLIRSSVFGVEYVVQH